MNPEYRPSLRKKKTESYLNMQRSISMGGAVLQSTMAQKSEKDLVQLSVEELNQLEHNYLDRIADEIEDTY